MYDKQIDDSCYQMAKDILTCHLGMSKKEVDKQLMHLFSPEKNDNDAQSLNDGLDLLTTSTER